MQINELNIKFSQGKANIVNELEMGKDYAISVKGSCVQIVDNDNQDGTINRCYVIKPEIVVVGDN